MDEAFQSSKRRLVKIQANNIVKVDMEDQSDDFKLLEEETSPNKHSTQIKNFEVDDVFWKEKLRSSSATLLSYPYAVDSGVTLTAYDEVDYILDTEGTRIQQQRQHFRLSTYIQVIADDGMNLEVYDYLDSNSENQLQDLDINRMISNVIKKAEDLRNAPVIDPFVGPAILRGRASAVFFHEILGHRVEADRQKRDEDGKTLTDKINQPIFPSFISVIDDPTLSKWKEQPLNGHYLYDDEGSKAQKVTVIENGVLKNFLTSRSPTKHFEKSNGHGRREEGNAPVSRQGNLIVQTPSTKSFADLKEDLLQEIQKGNHNYGLIFDDISGGFTFTGRVTPNSYNVRPVTVWRVYPDGREELVRGVDLIGTPLLTFQRIIDSSNEIDVFNGQCGAESGWVPVSAIAPDLLISEVEVQRKEKGTDRPPILPVPDHQ
jgi:predicted Zn-dependent protease